MPVTMWMVWERTGERGPQALPVWRQGRASPAALSHPYPAATGTAPRGFAPGAPRSHPQQFGLCLSEALDLERGHGGRGRDRAGGQLGRTRVRGRDDLRDDPHTAGVHHRGCHRLRAERGRGGCRMGCWGRPVVQPCPTPRSGLSLLLLPAVPVPPGVCRSRSWPGSAAPLPFAPRRKFVHGNPVRPLLLNEGALPTGGTEAAKPTHV